MSLPGAATQSPCVRLAGASAAGTSPQGCGNEVLGLHRSQLVRAARRWTLNEADAEDAVQETLLRALQYADLFDPGLPGWLRTTLYRVCMDQARARQKVGLSSDPGETLGPVAGHEELLCDRDELRWAGRLIAALPSGQRSAVALKASGLTGAEAAAVMGVTRACAEALLKRARATLRDRRKAALHVLVVLAGLAHGLRRAVVALRPHPWGPMGVLAGAVIALTVSGPTVVAEPDVRPDDAVGAFGASFRRLHTGAVGRATGRSDHARTSTAAATAVSVPSWSEVPPRQGLPLHEPHHLVDPAVGLPDGAIALRLQKASGDVSGSPVALEVSDVPTGTDMLLPQETPDVGPPR